MAGLPPLAVAIPVGQDPPVVDRSFPPGLAARCGLHLVVAESAPRKARRTRSERLSHGLPLAGPAELSTLARCSYSGYDNGMAVSKVSLSIEEDVLAEARERAGRRELSSYVTDALRRQLQHDRLGELLEEMATESGPIPDDLMEEARRLWRGPGVAPKPRRRSA
jgi:Arc/MetJ family transcription regulator